MKKRFIVVGFVLVLAIVTSAQAFQGLGNFIPNITEDFQNISSIVPVPSPPPIPGSLVLLGSGLAGLGLMRLRKRK